VPRTTVRRVRGTGRRRIFCLAAEIWQHHLITDTGGLNDSDTIAPSPLVPELIEQTCRTGHHEREPWHKQPGREAKRGAITGRHEATLSLLERSISLI
jgi:hypothetical protein